MSHNTKKYIQVSGLSCQDLPATGRSVLKGFKRIDTFYLFVTIDYQLQWTSTVQQSKNPKWEDNLYFDTTILDNKKMSIQVYARRSVGEDEMVGELKELIDVSELLGNENGEITQEFQLLGKNMHNKTHETGASIELTLLRTDNIPKSASLNPLVGGADDGASIISNKGKKRRWFGKILSGTSGGVGAIQDAYDVYRPLLQNIAFIAQVVGEIAEIYPYARMAWMALSLPLKVIIAQSERDKMILDLLETMNDIYTLVIKHNLREMVKIEKHQATIRLICQQTAECAWFISDYCSRKFAGRMAKTLTTDYTGRVDGYKQTFKRLTKTLMGEATLNIEIMVHQILAKVKETNNLIRMNDMRCAEVSYKPDPCLFGTRDNIIDNIIQWFSRPIVAGDNEKRVYWLSGVAGCGKSAVARSITERLEGQKRCVSFFFRASNQAKAGPNHLFATLSRNLALLDKSWEACLAQALEKISIPECSTVEEQFRHFISRPAELQENIGPILIVIDALDESGTVEQRESLLSVLEHLDKLASHFRFLITSRPESDIFQTFGTKSWVHQHGLRESDAQLTNLDIVQFVKWSLNRVRHLEKAYVDTWARQIASLSEGLFEWAATACRHVRGKAEIGHNPQERLDEVLKPSGFNGLYGLYKTILDQHSTFERDDITGRRFETIMGRILSLREPLSLDALSELWYDDEDKGQVEMILEPLGSVLSGVWQKGETVQPIHVSFADFLQDKAHNPTYWVNITEQNEKLAGALLREMQALLRFNICDLETSYKRNSEVEDLNTRITNNISAHLSYACRYWVDHLVQVPVTHEWAERIDSFMRSHLLFWFEALSLIGKYGSALDQLTQLQSWLAPLSGFDELKLFVQDVAQFGRAFAHVIQDSTPHLYLSVLPLIPRSSPVSKAYLSKYPGCLNIVDSHKISWPRAFLSIQNRSPVNAVAYSRDGKRIVSGSSDGEVRIWDSNTGMLVAGLFRGHTSKVTSVGFSPDGKQVVSGSEDNTVRIWNVDTGEPAAEPFRGHTDWVTSVGFSPDGKQVVSGSEDNTVRIWNVDTGEPAAEPFRGHTFWVTSVGFSPDGKQVVSSSADGSIRIWQYTLDPMHRSSDLSNSDFHFLLSPAFLHGFQRENGWVVSTGPDKELLFWTPEQFCPDIILPAKFYLFAGNPIRLDVRGYSHGSTWTQCCHPQARLP